MLLLHLLKILFVTNLVSNISIKKIIFNAQLGLFLCNKSAGLMHILVGNMDLKKP